jgi:hypothetical protein
MSTITWYAADALVDAAKASVYPVPVVLDVGCGIRPQQLVPCGLHLAIEPHAPYIARLREHHPDDATHFLLQATWDRAMGIFPDHSVDTIVAGDVIEHLEKSEGWRFLAEAERVARRQIVLFTPLGFHAQPFNPDDPTDRWGMRGGYWQQHRSGWLPDEFGDGWECLCCAEYHFEDEYNQPLEKGFGAFYAIWSRP